MKYTKKLVFIITAFVAVAAAALIAVRSSSSGSKYPAAFYTPNPAQGNLPADPCWFNSFEDKSVTYEMIQAWQDQQMHGYASEVPLSDAIKLFNQERECAEPLAPYPPLTEDEFIASIVAGPESVGLQDEPRYRQQAALWRIATRRMLPKGSLLLAWSGSLVQESPLSPNDTIRAAGITIALRLGLENSDYGDIPKPEQEFIIRRTYFKVEKVK
ncbi:MAG TPA: hypothetical protein VN345_07445 [Blastocatellia bacterium]|nr:hypothetical protein [Blastocatellia bacterium]